MNTAALLVRAGRVHADRPAIASGTRDLLTYGQLARRAAAIAGALRSAHGLVEGDRVALLAANHPHYVEALFGIWHAGLVAVPINAKLHPREVAFVLEDSGARLVFADAKTTAAAAEAVPPPTVIDLDGAAFAAMTEGPGIAMASRPADSLAWLFYTSGTTGRPKGAMLSHRNLAAMTACYFMDVDSIARGDCIVHAAPMSHGSGFYILPHVVAAARQVIPDSGGFDPAELFALIKAYKGVSLFAAPTMVRRMVLAAGSGDGGPSADTTNLKTIIYGGGPMYRQDLDDAIAAFGYRLAQIYGQGESPMTITALSKSMHADVLQARHDARLNSVGHAQSLVEVQVADAEGRPVPPGEAGEIRVRGDSVMMGYWNNPEATAAALRDGWLHTGDIGVLDEDGFLTLKDRSKDMIISGGSNIYPREVEEVLLSHPSVGECAVIGVPHADWGEEVCAIVVPAEGQTVDTDALDRLCLETIARFKRPRRWRVVDALPKNDTGKVLKRALRALVDDGTPPSE